MDIRSAIAAERREFAAVLDGLTPEQWNAPTLCEGWRVREVAAHMSVGFRSSFPKVLLELVKAGGNLNRMGDRVAHRDAAALSERQMAAALRDNADNPWTPPVGGITAALGHDVIHGLDITVALDLDRKVPLERVEAVLAGVGARTLRFFGAQLDGVRLTADDLDWSFGTGAPVSGSAQDLLLVVYGRKVPAGRLGGDAAARFAAA
ncbi:maleylpyruvate isomerase family mycothiol-dependent enzyme [Kitasatospora sp. NPDC094011]|uniref:maleylpyruvate isomerase family mycothiol-dependent enzyme n=1 Tax=Kitasatospora sp. NPDC094011 TaxID=3364090 RepID=UPI003823F9E2